MRSRIFDVMKAFSDLGVTATAEGALDKKTQALAKLGAARQDVHETVAVAV
jgi:alkylhydroperoxidase/carboxymuconolactone decarboxylase family protein YurZ